MQQNKVVAWLAQHNFPHGMVAFMDGLSADPLRQKSNYLKNLAQDVSQNTCSSSTFKVRKYCKAINVCCHKLLWF